MCRGGGGGEGGEGDIVMINVGLLRLAPIIMTSSKISHALIIISPV